MISRDMTIEDILRKHPQTAAVFRKFGLDCMECQIAAFEAVEHGAGVHRVDVEVLLKELNRVVEEKNQGKS
jgi:hybrid cluster-associated redox disulfide protein